MDSNQFVLEHQINFIKLIDYKMKIEDVFVNNKKWIEQKLAVDENYFTNLSQGQSPEFLYIGWDALRLLS